MPQPVAHWLQLEVLIMPGRRGGDHWVTPSVQLDVTIPKTADVTIRLTLSLLNI